MHECQGNRCALRKCDELKARKAFDPSLAEAIGETAMKLKKHEGVQLKVCNVPFEMNDRELATAIAMKTPDSNVMWRAKTITKLTGARFNFKNMLVQAPCLPPKDVVRGTYGLKKYTIVVMHYEPPKHRRSVVDKIMEREEPTSTETTAKNCKSTPVNADTGKFSMRSWSQVVKKRWSEEEDELEDGVTAVSGVVFLFL